MVTVLVQGKPLKTRPAVLALAGVLIFSGGSLAGERVNTRGVGMARTSVATSRGLEAVGINPANLAIANGTSLSISVLRFGAQLGSDMLDYDAYTTYFTGVETGSGRSARYLDDNDKRKILELFQDGTAHSSVDVHARILGVMLRVNGVGSFAVTISDRAAGRLRLPKDYVEFLFHGNPAGSSYAFGETDLRAAWTRAYTLSFGTAVPKAPVVRWLAVGASAKLVHGFAYYEIERFNTSLTTALNGTLTGIAGFSSRSSRSDPVYDEFRQGFVAFPAPAGTGPGFDLGATGGLTEYLSFGVSVTDIGAITWRRRLEQTRSDTTIVLDDPFSGTQSDALDKALKGKKREIGEFSTSLPTTLRLGFALELHKTPGFNGFPGECIVGLDYNQGLVDAPGTNTSPRVSLGVEYKPVQWLPVRSGLSVGGGDGTALAFGLGVHLGSFRLDLGSESLLWLLTQAGRLHGSAAASITLDF
jgi:hypothetical protein